MNSRFIRCGVTIILAISFLLCAIHIPASAENSSNYTVDLVSSEMSSFSHYISQYPEIESISEKQYYSALKSQGGKHITTEDDETAVLAEDTQILDFDVSVDKSCWCIIKVDFYSGYSDGVTAERSIYIDNVLPYEEAANISFHSVWSDSDSMDENGRFSTDYQGNELLPQSVELKQSEQITLYDSSGYIEKPLQFYFEKGNHTISFVPGKGKFVITGFSLYPLEDGISYKEYRDKYNSKKKISEDLYIIEGENYSLKSSSELLPICDKSSSATKPSDPAKNLLNTVGGTSWSSNGQWIEWTVDVKEDGLYRLGMRYRQNFLSGMRANRKLTIDGVLPFDEAANLSFTYKSSWQTDIFGNGKEDYWFFFTKGKHSLRLECSLGDSAPLLNKAENISESLSEVYEQLIMYMGSEPDINRDYKVEQMLPTVPKLLEENIKELKSLSNALVDFSGERGNANVAIDNIYDCALRMYKDSRDIPELLSTFQDYLAALSSWVQTQSSQSLQVDSLFVLGDNDSIPKANEGFIKGFIYGFKSFLASFVIDYSSMASSQSKENIEVWVNTGRDQAQVMKNMISNYFTPEKQIGVNLKLVSGQLLLATMAGVGPDVSLMNNAADVMNFAYRSAAEPLEKYEGFSEKVDLYVQSAWEPLSADGHIYAIPETQTFYVMFYRSDILSSLNLVLPNTWDELYGVIGELQRNNLEFGFPNSIFSYGLLLYQNGGNFYNKDGTGTALNSIEGIDTFKKWTRLYTNYGLPYEYSNINRFRSGEMPLLIGDYTLYYSLSVSAPEIKGKWGFSIVPGVMKSDGNVDRSVATTSIGCMMMSSSKNKEAAWEFLKWWTDTDTQITYGKNIESALGVAARYSAANIKVLEKLAWSSREINVLKAQLNSSVAIDELPGSYYLARYIENAFRRVVNYNDDERETITDYAEQIDEEIAYKRNELMK